jgi:type II secretion system protein G
MRKYILIALGVAATIGGGAYWYWSPYVALSEMRSAARDADPDQFNDHVDYPKLRESLKGQLSALLTQEVTAASGTGGAIERAGATLGGMLGLALVDRMVDAVVRPEAVMNAMQNGKFKLGQETQSANKQKMTAAEVDISTLQQALKLYKLDHGSYPTQEQGLKILVDPSGRADGGETYLEKLPLDPWGRSYQYRNPGTDSRAVDVTYLPPPISTQSTTESSDSPIWHTERKNVNMLIVYAGYDDKPVREKTGFVMAREGFARWKLTEIRLPAVGK